MALVDGPSSSTPLLSPAASNQSILLNPYPNPPPIAVAAGPRQQLQPPTPSLRSASLSRSSSISQPGDSAASRKIRFAPLPLPRKDDVFDESESGDSLKSAPNANAHPAVPSSPALSARDELSGTDPENGADACATNGGRGKQRRSWRAKLLKPLLPKASDEHLARSATAPAFPDPSSSSSLGDMQPLSRVVSESAAGSRARKDGGQRLLNGRVYGAGRRGSSAERAAKPPEPEFVEWGYGGMGSNSTGAKPRRASDVDWGRVQSGASELGGGGDREDDDDGSGMAWVRRRREKREQEQREREAREEHEGDQAGAGAGVDAPLPEHHHVFTSTLPAHHHRPHHHAKRRDGSGTTTPASTATHTPAMSRTNSLQPGEHEPEHPQQQHLGPPVVATAETNRAEEEEDEDEEEDEEDDADEEDSDSSSDSGSARGQDEDEDEEAIRKTSRSAGVEKISRHKE